MEISIQDDERRVFIWLTREEGSDPRLRATLRPIYEVYSGEKYLVAVYISGRESLREQAAELIGYNRIRLRELENGIAGSTLSSAAGR